MTTVSGSFIGIDQESSTTPEKTFVRQFVDILQSDIEGVDSTRKKYEVFVTGGQNQSLVKSSLYQTIYDQDFTLSTSNALFDITLGMHLTERTVENEDGTTDTVPSVGGRDYSYDSAGKLTGFDQNELMVREKVNIYRQYAQNLLGDANQYFIAPHGEAVVEGSSAKKIESALFLNFRRLFTRDNIFKGSFNLKINQNAAYLESDFIDADSETHGVSLTNLYDVDPFENPGDNASFSIVIDSLASTNVFVSPVAGEVSTLTSGGEYVGLIYYDRGIIILDTEKVFNSNQLIRGLIDSTSNEDITVLDGPWYFKNSDNSYYENLYESAASANQVSTNGESFEIDIVGDGSLTLYQPKNGNLESQTTLALPLSQPLYSVGGTNDYYNFYSDASGEGQELFEGKLYPDFMLKASIDNILDHLCSTRFGKNAESGITFRNETVINSKLIFCRAAPSQLNYSTNPTYSDDLGNITAISENGQPFSFVTTVGLYNSALELVAVAKTSRPIEKNKETDMTLRIRLDF